MKRGSLVWMVLPIALSAACSTSPMGRERVMLVPDSQMNQLGVQTFSQLKTSTPVDADPSLNVFVKCVAGPITEAAKPQTQVTSWEIVVFKDPTPNAFALPGGKIGVNDGIMKVAKNDAQLATVLAHETGHVIAKHGAERESTAMLEQGGLGALDAVIGNTATPAVHSVAMAALGVGTQVGITLPFSRAQEAEADEIGLGLMADAGFDPNQAIELWKNMMALGGSSPPQFLSDHPVDQNRIADLQSRLPGALVKYNQAKAAGRAPHCQVPH